MSENLYQRQESIGLNTDQSVIVVGCGGIGYHVAKMLAMSGVENIVLFDTDQWEEHNLNRIDLPAKAIGMNKAEATQMIIKQMRPNCNVKFFPFKFNDTMINVDEYDWIVDCTDVHAAQIRNQEIADDYELKYFKAGYNGTSISINERVAEWDVGGTVDGYTITPSWVVPAMIIASLAVGKVLKYMDKELGCDVEALYTR